MKYPKVITAAERAAQMDNVLPIGEIGRLWQDLHRYALRSPSPRAFPTFLSEIQARLPCGECLVHWQAWVTENPPAGDLFAWTVAAHNSVNARLGKPLLSLEQARARWAVDIPPK